MRSQDKQMEISFFGAQFSEEAREFGLDQFLKGLSHTWYQVLQTHDTDGLPFDLIYLKMKQQGWISYQNAKKQMIELNAEQFVEFMKMVRYGAETYGVGIMPAS